MKDRVNEELKRLLEESEPVLGDLLKMGNRVMVSRKRGEKWALEATESLCGIAKSRKWLEGARKRGTEGLKERMKEVERPFKIWEDQLGLMDGELRERVMVEVGGSCTPVSVPEVGELVFSKVDGYEVEDFKKIERKYLMVDHKAVMDDIKGGIGNIKGIRVGKKTVLSVRPAKSGDKEA